MAVLPTHLRADPDASAGIVIAANGNTPWGSLDSGVGGYYCVLQRRGSAIWQTVPVTAGLIYSLSFLAAERPGYGQSERMSVAVDGTALVEDLDPFDSGFQRHEFQFTASGTSAEVFLTWA